MTHAPVDPPGRAVGGRAVSARWSLLVAVLWIVLVGGIVATRSYSTLVSSVPIAAVTAGTWWRPLTVVDARGVWTAHRVRRGPTLTWAQVNAVVEPRGRDDNVALILTDGTVRVLAPIAAANAVSVARIGGKQLWPRPTPTPVLAPPRSPSQLEQDQALTVRAQRLTTQREHLQTQLVRRDHPA